MRSQLFQNFSELATIELPAQDIFSATGIAGRSADYVTVGAQGEPLLLLSCAGLTRPRPSIVLRYLRVEFGVHYRVSAGTTVVDGVFTVISLRAFEKNLFEPFCIAGEALIASLPQQPSTEDIDQTITRFVEMLAAIARPPQRAVLKKRIQG